MKYFLIIFFFVSFVTFADSSEEAFAAKYLNYILSSDLGTYPYELKLDLSNLNSLTQAKDINEYEFKQFIQSNIKLFDNLRRTLSDKSDFKVEIDSITNMQNNSKLVDARVYTNSLVQKTSVHFSYIYFDINNDRSFPIFGVSTIN